VQINRYDYSFGRRDNRSEVKITRYDLLFLGRGVTAVNHKIKQFIGDVPSLKTRPRNNHPVSISPTFPSSSDGISQ
jgi:hypothetical protein